MFGVKPPRGDGPFRGGVGGRRLDPGEVALLQVTCLIGQITPGLGNIPTQPRHPPAQSFPSALLLVTVAGGQKIEPYGG